MIDIAGALLELHNAQSDNRHDDAAGTVLFDPPIFAIAGAADPWFERFKQVIGPHHWTPQEAIVRIAPPAVARSVVCWALPITEAVRASNRVEKLTPSRLWAYQRTHADSILMGMSRGLEEWLRALGHAAIAPAQASPRPGEQHPELGSFWSQRHVAFVSGLGTFGISGGLITQRGIAHRLGSVVTSAALPVSPRAYGDDPFAWCLRSAKGTCGACIQRCPVGSVGQTQQDRNVKACDQHRTTIRGQAATKYGWQTAHYGCGLCQTAVPCEARRPVE